MQRGEQFTTRKPVSLDTYQAVTGGTTSTSVRLPVGTTFTVLDPFVWPPGSDVMPAVRVEVIGGDLAGATGLIGFGVTVDDGYLTQDDLEDQNDETGEDGRIHAVGDDCSARHYEDSAGRLACGADFMAGTICSLRAGHVGPDAATCLDCGGDWVNETCTCEIDPPDEEDLV
jgi:hypothetical protein